MISIQQVIQVVRRVTAPLERRCRLMVIRSVVSGVKETKRMRTLALRMLADDDDDDVEHFEPYGVTARPVNGAEAIVVSVGGSQDHPVAVVVSDRSGSRPTDLETGEVAYYSKHGQVIYLRTDGSVAIVPKEGAKVELGSEPAEDFVVLATQLQTWLASIIGEAVVVAQDGGAAFKANLASLVAGGGNLVPAPIPPVTGSLVDNAAATAVRAT